jgi:hypothetical protein
MSDSHPRRTEDSVEWVPAVVRRRYRSVALRVDRVGELVQVGVEDPQEPLEGVPADAPLAALDAADQRCVGCEAVAHLLLGQAGAAAQVAERTAKDDLVLLCRGGVGGVAHESERSRITTVRARVVLARKCATLSGTTEQEARARRVTDRPRGTEERELQGAPDTLPIRLGVFLARAAPGASNHKEEPT